MKITVHHAYWIAGVVAWLLAGAVVVGLDYGFDDDDRTPDTEGPVFVIIMIVLWPLLGVFMVTDATMRFVRRHRPRRRRQGDRP